MRKILIILFVLGSVTGQGQRLMINGWKHATGSGDEAALFITNTGITDSTIVAEIDSLVDRAKRHGWWTLCPAIYPFVGGTATTHKYNLKDARDLDAAYRLVFNGTWTHGVDGITGDGSTSYADTKLVPASVLSSGNTHVSIWCVSSGDGVMSDFGSGNGGSRWATHLRLGGTLFADQYNTSDNRQTASSSDAAGYYIQTRPGNTEQRMYKNGTEIGTVVTDASAGFSSITYSMYIGAINEAGTAENFSDRNYSFFTIGSGISAGIAALMSADVAAFQTAVR